MKKFAMDLSPKSIRRLGWQGRNWGVMGRLGTWVKEVGAAIVSWGTAMVNGAVPVNELSHITRESTAKLEDNGGVCVPRMEKPTCSGAPEVNMPSWKAWCESIAPIPHAERLCLLLIAGEIAYVPSIALGSIGLLYASKKKGSNYGAKTLGNRVTPTESGNGLVRSSRANDTVHPTFGTG